jgi:hypothetical protein
MIVEVLSSIAYFICEEAIEEYYGSHYSHAEAHLSNA